MLCSEYFKGHFLKCSFLLKKGLFNQHHAKKLILFPSKKGQINKENKKLVF